MTSLTFLTTQMQDRNIVELINVDNISDTNKILTIDNILNLETVLNSKATLSQNVNLISSTINSFINTSDLISNDLSVPNIYTNRVTSYNISNNTAILTKCDTANLSTNYLYAPNITITSLLPYSHKLTLLGDIINIGNVENENLNLLNYSDKSSVNTINIVPSYTVNNSAVLIDKIIYISSSSNIENAGISIASTLDSSYIRMNMNSFKIKSPNNLTEYTMLSLNPNFNFTTTASTNIYSDVSCNNIIGYDKIINCLNLNNLSSNNITGGNIISVLTSSQTIFTNYLSPNTNSLYAVNNSNHDLISTNNLLSSNLVTNSITTNTLINTSNSVFINVSGYTMNFATVTFTNDSTLNNIYGTNIRCKNFTSVNLLSSTLTSNNVNAYILYNSGTTILNNNVLISSLLHSANNLTATNLYAGQQLRCNTLNIVNISSISTVGYNLTANSIIVQNNVRPQNCSIISNSSTIYITTNNIVSNAFSTVNLNAGNIYGNILIANNITVTSTLNIQNNNNFIKLCNLYTDKLYSNILIVNSKTCNTIVSPNNNFTQLECFACNTPSLISSNLTSNDISITSLSAQYVTGDNIFVNNCIVNNISILSNLNSYNITSNNIYATNLNIFNDIMLSDIITNNDYNVLNTVNVPRVLSNIIITKTNLSNICNSKILTIENGSINTLYPNKLNINDLYLNNFTLPLIESTNVIANNINTSTILATYLYTNNVYKQSIKCINVDSNTIQSTIVSVDSSIINNCYNTLLNSDLFLGITSHFNFINNINITSTSIINDTTYNITGYLNALNSINLISLYCNSTALSTTTISSIGITTKMFNSNNCINNNMYLIDCNSNNNAIENINTDTISVKNIYSNSINTQDTLNITNIYTTLLNVLNTINVTTMNTISGNYTNFSTSNLNISNDIDILSNVNTTQLNGIIVNINDLYVSHSSVLYGSVSILSLFEIDSILCTKCTFNSLLSTNCTTVSFINSNSTLNIIRSVNSNSVDITDSMIYTSVTSSLLYGTNVLSTNTIQYNKIFFSGYIYPSENDIYNSYSILNIGILIDTVYSLDVYKSKYTIPIDGYYNVTINYKISTVCNIHIVHFLETTVFYEYIVLNMPNQETQASIILRCSKDDNICFSNIDVVTNSNIIKSLIEINLLI